MGKPRAVDAYLADTLIPVQEAILVGFQKLLDGLAGRACPRLEDNARVVDKVNAVARLCGASFFILHDGELARVGVGVKASPAAGQLSKDAPSVVAGVFGVTVYDPTGTRIAATNVTAFPRLIAARDLAHASAVWQSRPQVV